MSTAQATSADYKFFDFLAPYRWPNKTKRQIAQYRELVADGDLQIETILENALAINSNGTYERIAEMGRDFCDNSDSKKVVSMFRNNNIRKNIWTNSFKISKLKNKIGLIRAVCYSQQQDKFYFYAIPHFAYAGADSIDIKLDQSVGYSEPAGIPRGRWSAFMVDSFKELATITEKQATAMGNARSDGRFVNLTKAATTKLELVD